MSVQSAAPNKTYDKTRLPEDWSMFYEAVPDATHPVQIYPLNAHARKFRQNWEKYGESYIKGELTLLSISDCGDKDTPPGYPIHYLVAAAINGAPEKKLSMMEIRLALLRRFPYFANNLGEGVNWMDVVEYVLVSNLEDLFTTTGRARKDPSDTSRIKYCLVKVPQFRTPMGEGTSTKPSEDTRKVKKENRMPSDVSNPSLDSAGKTFRQLMPNLNDATGRSSINSLRQHVLPAMPPEPSGQFNRRFL